jgi:4-hydroxybutyryl-CoA dehydratase/vinylacetyl-CoA-Delta-isomerase
VNERKSPAGSFDAFRGRAANKKTRRSLMAMMNAKQYEDSLRKLKLNVYMFGKKVENVVDDPIIRPSMNAVAATYECAHQPEYEDLMAAKSHLTGKKINRFTHIHQSTEDLVKKSKMGRLLGSLTACCFQRCVGMDTLNALSMTTYDIDKKYGTEYNKRFLAFLAYVQEKDLTCDGAMTDPKGDRSKGPHQQADPDLFLHVVEERKDGIVVRGAKCHQTGAVNSHEIIVMPTISMRAEDKDYAICFALPSDARGITYILGRQSCDTRKLEPGMMDRGNQFYGGHEALVVFDNVFVPWERVFMYKEWDFAGQLVEQFASYHRQSYACKAGVGDVLIGAAQCIAEYNGVQGASHVKDKIIEMNHLNETLFCGSLACAAEGHKEPSGTYYVHTLLANVCKQNVTRFPFEIARLAQDIAGGLMVTLPSEQDFRSPEVGKWMEKYYRGNPKVPTEYRMRILRLIENLTLGTAAVGYLTESMHGAGSPQAQRIMIARQVNMEMKKKIARKLSGIPENG